MYELKFELHIRVEFSEGISREKGPLIKVVQCHRDYEILSSINFPKKIDLQHI